MDPLTAYDIAKFRMAERHREAERARMANLARSYAGPDEQDTTISRRWTVRQVVCRLTHVNAGV